jgi:hypothetical protein
MPDDNDLIGAPTVADAICERVIHPASIIELEGPALREARARTLPVEEPAGGQGALLLSPPSKPSGSPTRP